MIWKLSTHYFLDLYLSYYHSKNSFQFINSFFHKKENNILIIVKYFARAVKGDDLRSPACSAWVRIPQVLFFYLNDLSHKIMIFLCFGVEKKEKKSRAK